MFFSKKQNDKVSKVGLELSGDQVSRVSGGDAFAGFLGGNINPGNGGFNGFLNGSQQKNQGSNNILSGFHNIKF